MGISIRRNNFTSMDALGISLYQDMVDAGFRLVRHNWFGERTSNTQLINPLYLEELPTEGKTGMYLFQATNIMDFLSSVEPWYVMIQIHPNFIRSWVLTGNSYEEDVNGNIVVKEIPDHFRTDLQYASDDPNYIADSTYEYGHVSPNNLYAPEEASRFWLNLCPGESLWPEYEQVAVDENGFRIMNGAPLSYNLTVSSWGMALCIYCPSLSYTGRAHAWLVAQRLVNRKGSVDVERGFNPVWCMFSSNGGGQAYDSLFGDIDSDVVNPEGINQFCVRERDIHYPTPASSALVPTKQSSAVLNNQQSVRHTEKREWQINIPTGFSTWRHKYPLFMDLIGMASADTASHTDVTRRIVFADGVERSYTALLSNFKDDAGQRLFIMTDGPGTATVILADLTPHAPIDTETFTGQVDRAVKFFNLYLVDPLGTRVASDRILNLPYTIEPDSTAVDGVHYTISDLTGTVNFDVGDTKTGLYGVVKPQPGENVVLKINVDTSSIDFEVPNMIFTVNINWG